MSIKVINNKDQIKIRKDMWIGDNQIVTDNKWVFTETMQFGQIKYQAGYVKLFEELLNNAVDNYIKYPVDNYKISVIINYNDKKIEIQNTGEPIKNIKYSEQHTGNLTEEELKHKDEFISEVIFGSPYSSSNYDNSFENTNSINGLGAYLVNILSKRMEIETADKETVLNLIYEDGELKSKTIKNKKLINGYTRITYIVNEKEFNVDDSFDITDTYNLIAKRCIDVCGFNFINLNLKKIIGGNIIENSFSIKKIQDYYKLFGISNDYKNISFHSDDIDISFYRKSDDLINYDMHSCLVNGNFCRGKNIDYIITRLLDSFEYQNVNKMFIESHIYIISNMKVKNPSYDNQAKNNCTNKFSTFPKLDLKEIADSMMKQWKFKDVLHQAEISKAEKLGNKLATSNKVINIPGFIDANRTKKTENIDKGLFLVEGNSAMRLPLRGMKYLQNGSDLFGVYPLTGKPLNIQKSTLSRILDNKVIQNILKIIGLNVNIKNYDDEAIKKLRFQYIIITADADVDGSSICGLVINIFFTLWPNLLEKGFIKRFITPVVKVGKEIYFSETKFEQDLRAGILKNQKIQYFKGLGSLYDEDIKKYFQNLSKYIKPITFDVDNETHKLIKVYGSDYEDLRKIWVNEISKDVFYDVYNENEIKIGEFLDKELIKYSQDSIIRSIPSLFDGLKNVQRKILYWSLISKQMDCKQVDSPKVMDITGQISSRLKYHHGDSSLNKAIIYMAQNFVGTNNYPLLDPVNGFGDRDGGRDSFSSPRYINTRLNDLTKYIFLQDDLPLLDYVMDDGVIVEPKFMIPIIPTVFLNYINGMAVGYATKTFPHFRVSELTKFMLSYIEKQNTDEEDKVLSLLMIKKPEFKGFKGTIDKIDNNKYRDTGIYFLDKNILTISELPILAMSVTDYDDFLKTLMIDTPATDNKPGEPACISSFEKHHTVDSINFKINLKKDFIENNSSNIHQAIISKFKLTEVLCQNLTLLNEDEKVIQFNNIYEIFIHWCIQRESLYSKRKTYLLNQLYTKLANAKNKEKFISLVIDQDMTDEEEMIQVCKDNKVIDDESIKNINIFKITLNLDSLYDKDKSNYNSLLNIPHRHITYNTIKKLENEILELSEKILELRKKDIHDLWREDLLVLQKKIDEFKID